MHNITLPINEKPYIKSYTHTAFTSAILTSDLIGGEVIARYQINGAKKQSSIREQGCYTELDGDMHVIKGDRYASLARSINYFNVDIEDEISIYVDFRRSGSAWDSVGLLIDHRLDDHDLSANDWLVQFCCPAGNRLFITRNNEFIQNENFPRILKTSYWLKVKKNGLYLEYFYSDNGKKWTSIFREELPYMCKFLNLKAAVIVDSCNTYMDWMLHNYLQMYLKPDPSNVLMIDYYQGPSKHYKPYYTNQFFNCTYEYIDVKDLSIGTFNKRIREFLSKGTYIITEIDHFFVPNTEGYDGKHYFHEVMIYGVDLKKRTYSLMAYGKQGIVFSCNISFLDMWQAINKSELRLVCLNVDPNVRNYSVDKNMIRERLREYLQGANCDVHTSEISSGQNVVCWGIDIIKHFIDNEDALFILCIDTRLSFMIYEYSLIMLDRLIYLRNNNIIVDADNELLDAFEKVKSRSEILKNKILMSKLVTTKKVTSPAIRKYLEEVYELQTNAINKLCDYLK